MITNKNLKGLQFILLGTLALAIAGLFAVFLVAARSPVVSEWLPHKNFFKTALTIHVNLSVLVWLLCGCVAVIMEKINFTRTFRKLYIAMFLGFLVMAASVFDIGAESISSNYVPYISSKIFSYGLAIFLISVVWVSFYGILKRIFKYKNFSIDSATAISIIILVSAIAFVSSYLSLKSVYFEDKYNNADFFEILFWPAGHIMQFAYVQLAIFCWLKILERVKGTFNDNIDRYASIVNIAAVICAIPAIFLYEIDSYEYVNFYTMHMRYAGGIGAILAIIYVLMNLDYPMFRLHKRSKEDKVSDICEKTIRWSLILFIGGGIIAMMIEGSNTKIPAHYHGSIIGISLSLMGMAYIMLEREGYELNFSGIFKYQPFLYGFGQLIHIFGLAASGGYGALRKTPGVEMSAEAKFYMGIMGGGGLLSIIGGLLFVIIVFNAVKYKRS